MRLISVGNALDYLGYPFAPAAAVGGTVFTGGVLPIDPSTGSVVTGDIEVQTKQTLDNLDAVLTAAGATLGSVCLVQIFLTDVDADFAGFDRVYRGYFRDHRAPRATLGCTLALPDARIELCAVAAVPAQG